MTTNGDAQLRHGSERIEQLLDEVQRTAGPVTWSRVEELVSHLVAVYGAGIGALYECALAAGAEPARLSEAACAHELLASLLVLHGLHPAPLDERVEQALDEVRPYLGSHDGGVELLGIEDGVVRLRLIGGCKGCPASRDTIDHSIRVAIERAAPEVRHVEVTQ